MGEGEIDVGEEEGFVEASVNSWYVVDDFGVVFDSLVAAGDSIVTVQEHIRGHSQLQAESKDGWEWKFAPLPQE